jgi:hypothetical protein
MVSLSGTTSYSVLEEYDGRLTRAKNGCKDDRGWIALFSWDDELPGYLTMIKGE